MKTLQEIREEVNRQDWVSVPEVDAGTWIIVNVGNRAEFDRIALRCDELKDEHGHRLHKAVVKAQQPAPVRVVFMHWITRL